MDKRDHLHAPRSRFDEPVERLHTREDGSPTKPDRFQLDATNASVNPPRHRGFIRSHTCETLQFSSRLREAHNVFGKNARNCLACVYRFGHKKTP
jgi:hypothetical protein